MNSSREWFGKFRSVKTQSNLHLIFFERKNFPLSLYLLFHLTSIHFVAIRVSSILKVWRIFLRPIVRYAILFSPFSLDEWFASQTLSFFFEQSKNYISTISPQSCVIQSPESTEKISLKLDEHAWSMQYIILVW